MSVNVLITSASRKVSLIKAFRQVLSEEGGGEVIAVDSNPLSAALYFADHHYIIQPGNGTEFIETIIDLCQKHNIHLIVPTRDEELPVFAEARKQFLEIGVSIMVPDISVIHLCQDKRLFIKFCIQNDISVPKTYCLGELSDGTRYPLFIRGQFGKGSINVSKVNTPDDLRYSLTKLKNPVIQEYINAEEYTVDLFADFSGKVISVVPRERIRILGGESFIGMTSKNNKIIDESIRLAQALNLTGHNTIQCFLHEGKVLFIEVNPRFGGAANLGFAAGACTPRYLIQLLKGVPVNPRIGEFKNQYIMLRYTEDYFFQKEQM